jgi:hypothetical protein
MPMPMELKAAVAEVVIARAHHSNDEVARAMRVIFRYGRAGMLAACGGWAEIYAHFMFDGALERCPEAFVSLVIEKADGTNVNPEDAPAEAQGHIWAMRFIAALGNDDYETAMALYKVAERANGPLGMGPFALLDMAAAVVANHCDGPHMEGSLN